MSARDEDRYRSAAPAQSSRPAEHELPDGATCRNTPRDRKERALLSKRARSSSPSAYTGDAHDRWTRVREDDSRRDNSDRFAPATSPRGNRPIRERKAASASQSPEATRKRRHQTPDENPSPNRNPAKSAVPIKISSSTDARPTRNARGEVVMVSYDYALLQHRRRGTPLESFDMRQLRHQPALQPRRRWLSIQNYLHPYGVIDNDLLLPTEKPSRARQLRSPKISSSTISRKPEKPRGCTAKSPECVAVAVARVESAHDSHDQPSNLASPPTDARQLNGSVHASDTTHTAAFQAPADPMAAYIGMPVSSPVDPLSIADEPRAPTAVAHAPSPCPDQLETALTVSPTLEPTPCSVSSPQSLEVRTVDPSPLPPSSLSMAAALALLPPVDPDSPSLLVVDTAITRCRNLVVLVEEMKGRRRRREAAVDAGGSRG